MCPHRLNSAIHQHIFSHLVSTQFADCITYLPNTYFVLVCTGCYIFTSLLKFLSLNMSLYVSFPCFTYLLSFYPSVTPLGSAEQSWTTTQNGRPYYLDVKRATLLPIRFLAHIHVCSALPHKIPTTWFRLHPPVTSTEVRKHFHTPNSGIKTLELTPLMTASP